MRKAVLLTVLFACTFTAAASAQPAFIERKQVSPYRVVGKLQLFRQLVHCKAFATQ